MSAASCKIFTDLPLDEIARLEALQGAEINDAKKVLATEATALLHGRDEALKAEDAARATFEQGVRSEILPTFAVPAAELARASASPPPSARAGLVASNGEAKRHIAAGALRVNDAHVQTKRNPKRRRHHRRRHQALARQKEARAVESELILLRPYGTRKFLLFARQIHFQDAHGQEVAIVGIG